MYRRKPCSNIAPASGGFFSPQAPLTSASLSDARHAGSKRLSVLWRKATNKKNKTWEGDARAKFSDGKLLVTLEHSTISAQVSEEDIQEGRLITAGRYVLEISEIEAQPKTPKSQETMYSEDVLTGKLVPPIVPASPTQFTPVRPSSQGEIREPPPKRSSFQGKSQPRKKSPCLPPSCSGAQLVFKRPRLDEQLTPQTSPNRATPPKPLGTAVGVAAAASFIAPTPAITTTQRSASLESGKIEPEILCKLRPHQVEAVEFLYDCVEGTRHKHGCGALLADDMGLGKTLTSIALVWSLIKQRKIRNTLIVMPVTLLGHWKAEFKKWVGTDRIGVLTAVPGTDIAVFTRGAHKAYQVLLAGYERMRDISAQIKQEMETVDLIICDEGHRLKSRDSQTLKSIQSISGDRRIVLTGTPVQNDLTEFYTLADYVNPDVFGDLNQFQRRYENRITAAREPDASQDLIDSAKDAANDLMDLLKDFLLRRDISTLAQHLNISKRELLLLCKPTEIQASIYQQTITKYHGLLDCGLGGTRALEAISLLKKLANSASLQSDASLTVPGVQASGKLLVLAAILSYLVEREQKVVIVCSSTAMLDIIQKHIINMGRGWVRLDGSTPQTKRHSSVDLFNRCSFKRIFAFLLSSRSGGAGLSLVGAANLVMFDCDWNPAIDLQAMARIHRDGQKSPTTVYRLLTSGTIDEKILQRQISKRGLASSIIDIDSDYEKFSREDLRDIFRTPDFSTTLVDPSRLESYTQKSAADMPGTANCADQLIAVMERQG